MKFKELNLPEFIIEGLEKQGFESPTEIQEKCIPLIMSGQDVIGKSQTGSGKTYAYGIPAIIDTKDGIGVNVIVVCPTRELASQVCDEMRKLTEFKRDCKASLIVGGNSFEKQVEALKRDKTKIVIGTPGRIMDHLRRKTLKLNQINLVVLDEADEMLNMGFKEDIETILKSTNPEHQTVMFSATMPKPILALTDKFMKNPEMIELSHDNNTSKLIKQYYSNIKNKDAALKKLISDFNPTLSIVFCNTKRMVDDVIESLERSGHTVLGIHGDMRQRERKTTMLKFKGGEAGILVATDVAARGIDVKNVDMIFNYDIPHDIEYYVHRIGRTGRAGKTGIAVSLVTSKKQQVEIDIIRRETNAVIEEYKIEGLEAFSSENRERSPRGERGSSRFERRPDSRSSYGSNRSSDRFSRKPERSYGDRKPSFTRTERGESNSSRYNEGRKTFIMAESKDESLNSKRERDFSRRPSRDDEPSERPARSYSKSREDSKFAEKTDRKFGDSSRKPERKFGRGEKTSRYGKSRDEKRTSRFGGERSFSKSNYDKDFEPKERKRESKFNSEFSKPVIEKSFEGGEKKRAYSKARPKFEGKSFDKKSKSNFGGAKSESKRKFSSFRK